MYEGYKEALQRADAEGGTIVFGQSVLTGNNFDQGRVLSAQHPDAYYVKPVIIEMLPEATKKTDGIVHKETFAPVLFVSRHTGDIDEAIEMVNAPANAGLVAGIYSQSETELKRFAQKVESGDIVQNTVPGTVGPMRSGLGFGGFKPDSGQGTALDMTANPLSEFSGHTKRVTRNTKVALIDK